MGHWYLRPLGRWVEGIRRRGRLDIGKRFGLALRYQVVALAQIANAEAVGAHHDCRQFGDPDAYVDSGVRAEGGREEHPADRHRGGQAEEPRPAQRPT